MVDYFKTPQDPEGYSALIAETSDRRIDFSALEFETIQRAVIEYVRTYHRDKFNDFVASNGFMMLTEVIGYIGSVVANRGDILSNEGFLSTAFTSEAVDNHLNLIGQEMRRQTPATAQIMCMLDQPVATDIHIPTNGQTALNVTGADGSPVAFELFSAPYDWTSHVIIPGGKYGVVAWGIEGSFATPKEMVSEGGPDQSVPVVDDDILADPIFVTVDDEAWSKVDFIENYGPDDQVFVVKFTDGGMAVNFGDDVNGMAPLAGQHIRVRYRIGGGTRGRIASNAIDDSRTFSPEPPTSASVAVRFTNVEPSIGGFDRESIDDAKKRGPRSWSTHNFVSTGPDYRIISENFRHPVYGGVLKAVSTVHTQINANVVRVHVLAEGPSGEPVVPSLGLRQALASHLDEINVATDSVDVVPGKIKPVGVDMNVVIRRNMDASIVKQQVEAAVDGFFGLDKWQMGQQLYVSSLYDLVMEVNGVSYVDIFNPKDDILLKRDVGTSKVVDPYYYEAKNRLENLLISYPSITYNELSNFVFELTGDQSDITTMSNEFSTSYSSEGKSPIYIYSQDCCDQYVFATLEGSVDFDELITLGQKSIKYYYEKID